MGTTTPPDPVPHVGLGSLSGNLRAKNYRTRKLMYISDNLEVTLDQEGQGQGAEGQVAHAQAH